MIWSIAEDLGWPWAPSKFVPFGYKFTYIGFEWCLVNKTVALPQAKKDKYMSKLSPLKKDYMSSLSEIESIIGTLNHVTLVVPEGRSHLPSLYKLRSTFPVAGGAFIRRRVTQPVAEDVAWWLSRLSQSWCGIDVVKPPEPLPVELFVDAGYWAGLGWSLVSMASDPGMAFFREGHRLG